jgi:predicted secreted Zn-dependent protease
MNKCLLLSLFIITQTASAEISEHLDYTYYSAEMDASRSMRDALNKATPILQDNRKFHGNTKWYVKWNYRWFEQRDGRCKISKVTTDLTTTITLPKLTGTTNEQAKAFDTFISALRLHELGHYDIGKKVAEAIDKGILALPEMSSCDQLESTANALGYQAIDEGKAQDLQYDATTEHGKTQGAWLDN